MLETIDDRVFSRITGADVRSWLEQDLSVVPIRGSGLESYWQPPVGALTVVAGLSSAGKTSFMRWLSVMVRINGSRVAYFPYEEIPERHQALYPALVKNIIIAGQVVDERARTGRYETPSTFAHLKNSIDNARNNSVERDKLVDDVIKIEGLIVANCVWEAERIASAVEQIVNAHKNISTIFIDYLQIIPFETQPKDANSEQLKLKAIVNEFVRIAKKYRVAIITGAQFNNPEKGSNAQKHDVLNSGNVRAAKDIFHQANTFIGIWNQTTFDDDYSGMTPSSIHEVEIDIMKNRDGERKRGICFDFLPQFGVFIPSLREPRKLRAKRERAND